MKAKSIILAIFASLVLLLGNFMRVYGRNAAPVIPGHDPYIQLSTVTPYPTSTPGVSESAIRKFAHSEVLNTSAHGIPMSAANFRLDKNVIMVDVCYQYPDNRDWLIYYGVLQIQDNSIPLLGSTGIEFTKTLRNGQKKLTIFPSPDSGVHQPTWQTITSDGSPNYRCDTLSFLLSPDLSSLSHVKLVIKQLYAVPNEGEGCYEYREAVQRVLDAKGSGIKINCTKSNDKFGGDSHSTVVKKPISMKPEEANLEVWHAYQEYHTFNGSWVFEGEVKNTAKP